MVVYVVLYDRPIAYCDYCETEIIEIFKNKKDAEERAQDNENYWVQEWYVTA